MGGIREGADLAHEALSPRLDVALPVVRLRYPHTATGDDVGDDVQALHLVRPSGVVRHDRQVTTSQVLDQGDACGLVFDQDQVNPLGVLALPKHDGVLVDHLGAQVRVLEMLLPAVDHHDAHWAVQGLEHAERDAGGRVVLGLL